jgi:hypothetical protein
MTRWTGPAEDVEARACPAAKPRAHLTPHPADRAPAPPALATGVLTRIEALLADPAAALSAELRGSLAALAGALSEQTGDRATVAALHTPLARAWRSSRRAAAMSNPGTRMSVRIRTGRATSAGVTVIQEEGSAGADR